MLRTVVRPDDGARRPTSGEEGRALVKVPIAVCGGLLVLAGLTTGVQVAWTDLALSSALGSTTRFASNVSYAPGSAGARHSTQAQVMRWAADVAAESHVEPDDLTVTARHLPSGAPASLDQLVVGDEVTVSVKKTVSNPLYRIVASTVNAVTHTVGGDDVMDPAGVDVKAHATNHVS